MRLFRTIHVAPPSDDCSYWYPTTVWPYNKDGAAHVRIAWFDSPSHAESDTAVNAFGALTCGAVRPTTVAPSPVPDAVTARRRNVMPPC